MNIVESYLPLKASPLFKIEAISFSESEVTVEQPFQITMTIVNNALCDIPCDSVSMTLTGCVMAEITNPRLEHIKTPLSRQTSNNSLDNKRVVNLSSDNSNCARDQVMINLRVHNEGNEASGITCVNSHEVLKRNDSSGGIISTIDEKIVKDMMSQCVLVSNVILVSGENKVILDCEVYLYFCL